MAFGADWNSVIVVVLTVGGFLCGVWFIPAAASERGEDTAETRTESPGALSVSVNLAILYATLVLVLSAIVSEWPPEGQATHALLADLIFFGSILATSVIGGRIVRLIVDLELGLNN